MHLGLSNAGDSCHSGMEQRRAFHIFLEVDTVCLTLHPETSCLGYIKMNKRVVLDSLCKKNYNWCNTKAVSEKTRGYSVTYHID